MATVSLAAARRPGLVGGRATDVALGAGRRRDGRACGGRAASGGPPGLAGLLRERAEAPPPVGRRGSHRRRSSGEDVPGRRGAAAPRSGRLAPGDGEGRGARRPPGGRDPGGPPRVAALPGPGLARRADASGARGGPAERCAGSTRTTRSPSRRSVPASGCDDGAVAVPGRGRGGGAVGDPGRREPGRPGALPRAAALGERGTAGLSLRFRRPPRSGPAALRARHGRGAGKSGGRGPPAAGRGLRPGGGLVALPGRHLRPARGGRRARPEGGAARGGRLRSRPRRPGPSGTPPSGAGSRRIGTGGRRCVRLSSPADAAWLAEQAGAGDPAAAPAAPRAGGVRAAGLRGGGRSKPCPTSSWPCRA